MRVNPRCAEGHYARSLVVRGAWLLASLRPFLCIAAESLCDNEGEGQSILMGSQLYCLAGPALSDWPILDSTLRLDNQRRWKI